MSDIFPSSTIRSYASKHSPTNPIDKISNILNDNKSSSTLFSSNIMNSNEQNSNNSTPTTPFTLPSLINKTITGPCNICKIEKSPFWEESMGVVFCKNCFKKVIDQPSNQNLKNQTLPSFSQLPKTTMDTFNNNQQKKFKDNFPNSKSFLFDEEINNNSSISGSSNISNTPPNQAPIVEQSKPESYYCKYCEKTYPSTSFKNIQAFGAHCSNCSRKRKIRDDGFSFVPEMGSFEHQNQSSHQLPPQSLLKYRKIDNDTTSKISAYEKQNITYPRLNSITGINNLQSDDIHRIPYISPQSSPLTSPRMQIDDGSLRFGLLDVIEDKLAEENELELIRKDLKNISNEITIQDMQRERDIHDLSNNLLKELRETQSRMFEDINEKMKTEELELAKIKERFISEYMDLERELNDLISEQQRSSKDHVINDEENHHELNDSTDELKIDDGNDSIPNNHSSKQQATEQASKIKIDVIRPTKNDEIVKKIEVIKKKMNEKIMNINLQLSTQGRELERLVSLESNEFEKHSSKKFEDIRNNVNDTTEALVNSFEILDKILISQNFN